ncbi:transglutaminase-like domain-containing protein [Stieleria varia]|uniref:Protein-glutamine gamma-glutamyltransferase n=1 Tax=Stieleria varia TaxID=2528005 RepID=A0A5C6AW31_9BACT|nr:transglutaminase-like domain-containing protein [Stieleria varia]TWU02334.1 Protein-glutamine gamma-glutamyltransferase [Stieleria varia]
MNGLAHARPESQLVWTRSQQHAANWFLPILMLIQSAFVGNTFATMVPLMVLSVISGLAAWLNDRSRSRQREAKEAAKGQASTRRSPDSMKRRWLLVTALLFLAFIASLIWRVSDYLGNQFNPVALFVDSAAHTALLVSLVLWAAYPRRGHPVMLGCGVAVVMLAVAAGGVSQGLAAQIAVALSAFAVFAFGSRWIGLRWHSEQWDETDSVHAAIGGADRAMRFPPMGASMIRAEADGSRMGLLYSILTLSAILMATSAVAQFTGKWLPDAQGVLYRNLQSQLESISERSMLGGGRYVRGSKLGSIRNHRLSGSYEISLHAYAGTQPGYLRGTVFDLYYKSRWYATHDGRLEAYRNVDEIRSQRIKPTEFGQTSLVESLSRNRLARFPLVDQRSPSLGRIEIHNRPEKGPMVFTPLTAQWLEASSSTIYRNQYGVIESGVDVGNPYVVDVGVRPEPQKLLPIQEQILVSVPDELQSTVRSIANRIAERKATPRAKAKAIADYFQQNYSYSDQGTKSPPGVDPVVHFLNVQHAADCEYFATATALMLRSVDIPSRYVTGYVVTEYDDELERWVGRNRDAHAWVEAYDSITEEWFPVESTVGRKYTSLPSENAQQLLQGVSGDSSDADADSDSFFARALGWILAVRATDPLIILFRFAQAPLFCIVLFLLWYKYRRRSGDETDPDEIVSRKLLSSVDRKLKKQRMIRAPHETLHQFATRVDQAADENPEAPAMLKQAAQWYRAFADARYQGQRPSEFTS